MTSCTDIRESISAYADNELDINERLSFEEHIKNCPACKGELEDMLRIIRICNDMPQQELPAGFKAELHEKLTAVSVRQENIYVVPKKPKKIIFARTFASIAAGMLLIFLGGSIVKFGLLSGDFSTKSMNNAEMTAQAPAEAPAETPASAPVEASEAMDEDAQSNKSSIARSSAVTQDTMSIQTAETAEDFVDGSADVNYGILEFEEPMEAPVQGIGVDRSEAMEARKDITYKEEIDETVSRKSSTLTITVKDTVAVLDSIKALASAHNGVNPADNGFYSGQQYEDDLAFAPAVQDEAGDKIQLQYTFTEADYAAFTAALNDTFGAADVQAGAFVSEDMTDKLNILIDQSISCDNEIQKLQKRDDEKDKEEINKLKNEKESVTGQIEKIRLNADFVTVTVYVNEK